MNKVILVVNAETCAWLPLMLSKAGYSDEQVIRAASLKEGFAQEAGPPVIITDMELPDAVFETDFDSLTVRPSHIPIILLASADSRDIVFSALRLGIKDILFKDQVTPSQLKHTIESKFSLFTNSPVEPGHTFETEQKGKIEQALIEKTHELHSILESITDGFYIVDQQWRFTYTNSKYEKMHNLTREEIIGRNIWELFPYKKQMRYYTEFEHAVREKVSVHFEEYNTKNNMWVWINAYPFRDGLAVYFRDITEQKRTEEKINKNEQNLRAIINNTRDLIWSVDREYQMITGNVAFWERIASLTGKTGSLNNADLPPELLKSYITFYNRVFDGEIFKTIRKTTHPVLRYEELSFNPIYDHDNKVTGVNCFLRDITEQYDYLNKIEKQNIQLREIAWIQAHSVRSPLANILGLIQLFDLETEKDSHSAGIIEKLRHSAYQLDKVISNIISKSDTTNKSA